MSQAPLIEPTPEGLFCSAGDFYIDPLQPVPYAVLTHAHADHARPGSGAYLTARDGEPLLRHRLGPDAIFQAVGYGETVNRNGVAVSLHPAGHIRGSSQVRIAHRGEVWVVSGDYKTAPDPTCTPFEPVPCHTFVTESTFGLPIFRWPSADRVMDDLKAWWSDNRRAGRTSLLYVYALGKAQRVLAALTREDGPVLVHGAVAALNTLYTAARVALCPTRRVSAVDDRSVLTEALVLAPPSAAQPGWLRRFPSLSEGFASGWMQVRGFRRRRALDRGFILSDHADWPGLIAAIRATGAERVWTTHGFDDALARYLTENGFDARSMETRIQDPSAHAADGGMAEGEDSP